MANLAREIGLLEQQAIGGEIGDPEQFLEELFRARHQLLTVPTMAAQSREVYGRAASLTRVIPAEARPLVADIVDQFGRVRSVAAAERLAVIAAVTLPIAALSSIYGMNVVIVNSRTQYLHLAIVLAVMILMSAALLRWAKRQGWW